MVKKSKPTYRRPQGADYEFRDGRMHHNYKVYDNGNIDVSQHKGEFEAVDLEEAALRSLLHEVLSYIDDRKKAVNRRREQVWNYIRQEMAAIDLPMDEEKYIYAVDFHAGVLKKTAKPSPAIAKPQEPR